MKGGGAMPPGGILPYVAFIFMCLIVLRQLLR